MGCLRHAVPVRAQVQRAATAAPGKLLVRVAAPLVGGQRELHQVHGRAVEKTRRHLVIGVDPGLIVDDVVQLEDGEQVGRIVVRVGLDQLLLREVLLDHDQIGRHQPRDAVATHRGLVSVDLGASVVPQRIRREHVGRRRRGAGASAERSAARAGRNGRQSAGDHGHRRCNRRSSIPVHARPRIIAQRPPASGLTIYHRGEAPPVPPGWWMRSMRGSPHSCGKIQDPISRA